MKTLLQLFAWLSSPATVPTWLVIVGGVCALAWVLSALTFFWLIRFQADVQAESDHD